MTLVEAAEPERQARQDDRLGRAEGEAQADEAAVGRDEAGALAMSGRRAKGDVPSSITHCDGQNRDSARTHKMTVMSGIQRPGPKRLVQIMLGTSKI